MTPLREELARAICKTTAFNPADCQIVCKQCGCRADAILPILTREIAAARKQEGEKLRSVLMNILSDKYGSLIGKGYQRGARNVVMILEVSVNHVLDAMDVLEDLK
jgi:hypothetical protein